MSTRNARFEASDAQLRPILWLGTGLAVLIAGGLWVSSRITHHFQAEQEASQRVAPMQAYREPPSGPLLQASPNREIAEQRAYEARLLEHFEFIDEANGIVRIPIETAMELVAEESRR